MNILTDPAFADVVDILMKLLVSTGAVSAAYLYERAFGRKLDKQAQATLHSALSTGAYMAWARFEGQPTVNRNELQKIAVAHVLGVGAGDSVRRLSLTTDNVNNLAAAKLMEFSAKFQGKNDEASS